MPRPGSHHAFTILCVIANLLAGPVNAQSGPENKRCLTRDQLNIEPIFSACPALVDTASVSDNSFIARLYINGGPSRYTMRWRGQDYFNEDVFTYNEATGLYDGFCATRACSIGPGGWVQMEHWDYFVGTLLAQNVGAWTYEELHDDVVFQSRHFDVKELNLEAVSGSGQIGLVDQNLPAPLVLRLESFEGTGIEDEVIGWSIDGPKGAKGAAVYGIGSTSKTNAEGLDNATIRLGSKPGTYTVTLDNRRVTAASQPSFSFTAIDDIEDTAPEQDHPDVEEGVGDNRGQQCDAVGNPIVLSIGNKFQREADIEAGGLSPIEFVRYHNSLGFVSKSFVNYWTHSYDRYVAVPDDPVRETVKVIRPDGRKIGFNWNGSAYEAGPGIHATLEETASGWLFIDDDHSREQFDADGLLLDITDRSGRVQTARYDMRGRLDRIEDGIGGSLDFAYDGDGRLASVTDQAGRSWSYGYEMLGRLARVEKPDGTIRQYHYEDLRHAYALTGITLEDGQRYSWYEYDEQGRAISSRHSADAGRVDIRYEPNGDRIVLDALGNATVYETRIENRRGLLDGISGPICSEGCGQTDTRYTRDADLNVTSKTVYGITTKYGDYDSMGQPGYRVDASGTAEERRVDYEYDPRFRGHVTRITEPSVYPGRSRVTTRSYDEHGNLVREHTSGFDPSGREVSRTITHAYDGPFGQLSATDGPRDDVEDVTTYEYYPDDPAEGPNRARLKSIIDPGGIVRRGGMVYGVTGKITAETRPNGVRVDYEYYAGSDRIKAVTESAGELFNRTQWEYLPTGDVRRVIVDDEAGHEIITQFAYDTARRLKRVESRVTRGQVFTANQWVNFELDAAGNVIAETRESGDRPGESVLIQRVFDAYNRVASLQRGGVTELAEYNPDGTLAAKTDGNGNTTNFTYDALKRLTQTTRLGQVSSTLAYDTHDNLLTITDPEGHSTRYLFDDLGNRVQEDSPDSGITRYTYNASGQVTSQVTAGGQLTQLSYDAAGRLIALDREGADDDVAYAFGGCSNGQGRLCTVSTGWGHTIQYEWNALGEIASVTSSEGRLGYGYGPLNALTTIEYPSGRTVLFEIDGGGLAKRIRLRSNDGTETILVDNIEYSALGRPVAWQFANGRKTSVILDPRQRTTAIEVDDLWSWQATRYDANDNILELSTGPDNLAYGYDALNRLTSADSATARIAYGYDDVGNRLSHTLDGNSQQGAYEAGSNRLLSFGARQYTLDPNGNTTGLALNQAPARTYVRSGHGRLVRLVDEGSGSELARYRYDGLGQRVEKLTATDTRRFVYGPDGELLAELDGAGNILHEYVYLAGQPVADLYEVPEEPPTSTGGEMIIDDTAARVHGANWQRKSSAAAVAGTYLQNRKRDDRAIYWYVDQEGFQGGSHDVWVRWLQPPDEGSYTVYRVNTASAPSQRIIVDHLLHRPGDWVFLGNYDFAAAGASPAQYVALTGFDNRYGSEGTFLEADAVKLQPTSIQQSTAGTRFIHGDHLGTPQRVTDAEGRVIWSARYLPFGEASVDEDPDGDGEAYELNLRFPGQYHDAESQLHYNYFRMYDPTLGRYLESDPIGVNGGLNTFLYAGANPTRFFDPLGLAVRGEWIESPRFNLQEAGIDDWQFISPTFSDWGYLQFIRLQGHARGYVNIDVRCTERCDEWEIHDRVNVSAQGSIDVGPNLYALGTGLVTRNPVAGVGANMALGGAALLQAELHFLDLARQQAGPLIAALLADGPTLICLGSDHDDF